MSTATTMESQSPSPIPAPPDFPVTWEDPEDERLFWTLLLPDQVLPLAFSILVETADPAWSAAARAYEFPLSGPRSRRINTYFYRTMIPAEAPPDELAAQSQRAQENVRAAMARLGELWEMEWLPEIKGHLAFWEAFDLRGATRPQLLAHLDETLARTRRLWELHSQILFPALAVSLFEELYRDLFEETTAFDAYRLLEGFDNKTLERDRALWTLSRKALASPPVLKVLQEHAPPDVPARLEESAEGRVFLAELHTFLAEYGYLVDRPLLDLDQPTWIEDPTPAIQNLKDYVSQPDRDLAAEMAAVAAEREQLVAVARDRLQGYPQPVVGQFKFLLKAAQQAIVLTEDHAYWIDQRGVYPLRQVVLEFGRRLAEAGVIAERDNVFFLTLDGLRETAAQVTGTEVPGTSEVPGTWRQLVAERRAEEEHFAVITPPPALGTPPFGPPPDDPFTRAMGKFFGTPRRQRRPRTKYVVIPARLARPTARPGSSVPWPRRRSSSRATSWWPS